MPYPLSCRPQAWAAASAVAVAVAALGIEPDVPGETVVVNPAQAPWNVLELSGLRLGEDVVSLRLDEGGLTVVEAPRNALVSANTDSPR
jgi:glycogen debranching enzyme